MTQRFPIPKILPVALASGMMMHAATFAEEAPLEQRSRDIAWIDDVVMNICTARTFSKAWGDNAKRLRIFEDFDPDAIDFWGGQMMNGGDFFRNRGVAVSVSQANEYDAHILDTASHWDLFYRNGISVRETGEMGRYVPEVYAGEYGANPASERWNHMLAQHMFRMVPYADLYFQDNICNPTEALGMGFEDSLNDQFVAHLREAFDAGKLAEMGIEAPDSFHIRTYLAEARRRLGVPYKIYGQAPAGQGEKLIRDPVIHEFIKFSTRLQVEVWRDFVNNARDHAKRTGQPVSAYQGNQAGIGGKRVMATLQSQTSDIVWIEAAVFLQPSYGGARQAESTTVFKVGDASGGYRKPLRIVKYPDTRFNEDVRMPFLIYGAETYANGAVPVWGYSLSVHQAANLDTPVYGVMRDFARHVNAKRGLLVDRERVADTAVVLSLPTLFWRQFSSLRTEGDHVKHFNAVARFLEDHHLPWEALVFGYPGIFDDTAAIDRLGRYRTVVVPAADAISDRQAGALAEFVRAGGKLVLWGDSGANDGDLMPRQSNAFDAIESAPGKGRVVRVSPADAEEYFKISGYVLPLGQNETSEWRFTFTEPREGWQGDGFDDSAWKTAITPFGSRSHYGERAKTPWAGPAIWMRKEIELAEIPQEPVIHFSQPGVKVVWVGAEREVEGDGLEVYINGVFAGSSKTRWSGIHAIPVTSHAREALRVGRNTIAVRSQQSNAPRHYLDVGVARYPDESRLVESLDLKSRLFEATGLSPNVWINVFRHGNGPMRTVHFVNYDLDPVADRPLPQGPFKVTLRPDGAERITSATYEPYDGQPIELPIRRVADGGLEVDVPGVDLWGILTFAADHERAARAAAVAVRKYRNRLDLATRRHAELSKAADPFLAEAEQFRDPPEDPDGFAAFVEPATAAAAKLATELERVSATLSGRPPVEPAGWLATKPVRQFDFGHAGAEPGWTQIHAGMRYFANRGFGWTHPPKRMADYDQNGPDALLRDFIGAVPPSQYLEPLSINHNRYYPLAHPLKSPGSFRVDLPNGDYVASVVTGCAEVPGSHSDERGIATTEVAVNGVRALAGAPLSVGRWVARAIPLRVTAGHVDFTFSGHYVGPYFHNSTEWQVAALTIHKADDAPRDLRKQIAGRQLARDGLLRTWKIVGPFEDPLWNGLDVTFPAEHPLDPDGVYSGWSGDGSPVRWFEHRAGDPLASVSLGTLIDERDGRGSSAEGAAGLALARVISPIEGEGELFGSFSGRGLIRVNGEEVIREVAVGGLRESSFRMPVRLRKGVNEILVKSIHCWGGPWEFHVGILGPDGKPLQQPESQ